MKKGEGGVQEGKEKLLLTLSLCHRRGAGQKFRVNLPRCCRVESCSRPRRARRTRATRPDISSSGVTRRPPETEPCGFWKLEENVR